MVVVVAAMRARVAGSVPARAGTAAARSSTLGVTTCIHSCSVVFGVRCSVRGCAGAVAVGSRVGGGIAAADLGGGAAAGSTVRFRADPSVGDGRDRHAGRGPTAGRRKGAPLAGPPRAPSGRGGLRGPDRGCVVGR